MIGDQAIKVFQHVVLLFCDVENECFFISLLLFPNPFFQKSGHYFPREPYFFQESYKVSQQLLCVPLNRMPFDLKCVWIEAVKVAGMRLLLFIQAHKKIIQSLVKVRVDEFAERVSILEFALLVKVGEFFEHFITVIIRRFSLRKTNANADYIIVIGGHYILKCYCKTIHRIDQKEFGHGVSLIA